jgi:4,5-dihydroxyphthalate decarboxylase
MHIVVMRRAVYEKNRWLAAALINAFQSAKQHSFDRFREGLYPLPWQNLDFDFARGVMGDDIYSYGVKQNLPTLQAATLYSHEQGLTERRFEPAELFAPETLDI